MIKIKHSFQKKKATVRYGHKKKPRIAGLSISRKSV
jgi:hypothetical protein